MTKHLRLIMLSLLAMICMGGVFASQERYMYAYKYWRNNCPCR